MQEKHQLESALRKETLANEEQRNYIEILKNAVDQKMDGLGLGDLLSHKQLQKGQDPVSVYAVITEIKKESDFWKKESKQFEETLQQQQQIIEHEDKKALTLQSQMEELEKN